MQRKGLILPQLVRFRVRSEPASYSLKLADAQPNDLFWCLNQLEQIELRGRNRLAAYDILQGCARLPDRHH